MSDLTLPVAAALAWLFTPFITGALVARSDRLRAAVARHLTLCLTAGWLGIIGLVWGGTSLNHPAAVVAFLVGGPLGGLSIWTRSAGDDDPGDDPPDDPEAAPPPWDWDRFERDLHEYDVERLIGSGDAG